MLYTGFIDMTPQLHNFINKYFQFLGIPGGFDHRDPAHQGLFKRSIRDATEILKMAGNNEQLAIQKMTEVVQWADEKNLDWSLSTVIKRWFNDNSPEKPRVTTSETWKDELHEQPRDQTRIDSNLNSIRDILRKKGIRSS